MWVLAKRGERVDYTVRPLRLDARKHRPFVQTKERILMESSHADLRPHEIHYGNEPLQHDWVEDLDSE